MRPRFIACVVALVALALPASAIIAGPLRLPMVHSPEYYAGVIVEGEEDSTLCTATRCPPPPPVGCVPIVAPVNYQAKLTAGLLPMDVLVLQVKDGSTVRTTEVVGDSVPASESIEGAVRRCLEVSVLGLRVQHAAPYVLELEYTPR